MPTGGVLHAADQRRQGIAVTYATESNGSRAQDGLGTSRLHKNLLEEFNGLAIAKKAQGDGGVVA